MWINAYKYLNLSKQNNILFIKNIYFGLKNRITLRSIAPRFLSKKSRGAELREKLP